MIVPVGNKPEDFEFLERIGRGGYAEVHKARSLQLGFDDDDHHLYAIKKIVRKKGKKGHEKGLEDRIKNEIEIHKNLCHQSVVKFYSSFEEKGVWFLVLELCDGGTLEDLVNDKPLSEEEAGPLIIEVIEGVYYLHNNGVIHRDLKPRNILLAKNKSIRIADFGFAVKYNAEKKPWSVLGTQFFMAPEIKQHKPYDYKVDVYSVGCIIYKMLYGDLPSKNTTLSFPKDASDEARELLKDMLEVDPSKRIEMKNVLQYRFYKKYKGKVNESNRQKSNDSGMNSLSSSRSSQKGRGSFKLGKGEQKEKENKSIPTKRSYNEKYSYKQYSHSSSGHSSSRSVQNDHNYEQQRAKSPCQPKLKIRHESQFEIPMKSAPEGLLYPDYLQNLTEDNINKCSYYNSVYSCYNGIDSNKIYESRISKQGRTYSQDDIPKHPCSHDQYCLPEQNCQHKSSCCCHQNPVLVKRNCNSYHHSYEKEKKQDIELKNPTIDRGKHNVSKPEPLTTYRLEPKRVVSKNAIVAILNDGQVCVEFLSLKKKISYVVQVCFVSHDGLKITIYIPKNKIVQSEKPPPLPDNTKEVQYFRFEDLPQVHWKKYHHAKNFVDTVKARTPKVTIYGKDAKCVMMEKTPCQNYQMNFYDGYQITETGGVISVMDQNGTKITNEKKLEAHFNSRLNTFNDMKEKCCKVEACLEDLSESLRRSKCDSVSSTCFPVTLGRRPKAVLKSSDDNKENASPRNMHSSILSGTIAMKSYSGSINTVYSSTTNSPTANISSPLLSRKIITTQKDKADVAPALKRSPWIDDNGWVVAEYEDDIQMWFSMNEEKNVFFLDSKRQQWTIKERPDLSKRFNTDQCYILRCALSEVNKTK